MGRAKVRAVIFDLDDTLLDHSSALRLAVSDLYSVRPELITKFPSEEKFYRAWQEAQDKHYSAYLRGSLSHAEQKIFRIREVWQPIANLSEAECFQVYDHFQTLYESHWRIFPDVFPCLEALVPLKVGLISNGWAPQQKRKLLKENLYQRFLVTLISSEVGMSKPEPEIFLAACAALSVHPEEAMYVGDLYALDVRGALAAGMVPVWLRRNANHMETPAVLSIRSLNELAAVIASHNKGLKMP